MDRGTWWATVHGVTKSQAQLSNQERQHNTLNAYVRMDIYIRYVSHQE